MVTSGGTPASDFGQSSREGAVEVLGDARRAGFLGPGPVEVHVEHALTFATVVESLLGRSPARLADLGSGGGVPGLILAMRWPESRVTLIEASQRRSEFLEGALRRLALSKTTVVRERAEALGRQREYRGAYETVVARSFGPPAVTAECAAPLLGVGGLLVVSEPPGESGEAVRWSPAGLALLGMELAGSPAVGFNLQVMRQAFRCAERYPRRVGVPRKRPLFGS